MGGQFCVRCCSILRGLHWAYLDGIYPPGIFQLYIGSRRIHLHRPQQPRHKHYKLVCDKVYTNILYPPYHKYCNLPLFLFLTWACQFHYRFHYTFSCCSFLCKQQVFADQDMLLFGMKGKEKTCSRSLL